MKNKFKVLISLLLSFFITSCNNDSSIYIGDHFATNIIKDTYMKVEINQEKYNIDDIKLNLYLGFTNKTYQKEIVFGLYLFDYSKYYGEYEELLSCGKSVSDITNIENYYYVDSFTYASDVEKYRYSLTKKGLKSYIINYNNYYKLTIPKNFLYKSNSESNVNLTYSSHLMIKLIAFEKQNGEYVCSNTIEHNALTIEYVTDKNTIAFGYDNIVLVDKYY